MTVWPTPSEERWLALARRLRRSSSVAPFAERTGNWRNAMLPGRCVFFALGLIAVGMVAVILDRLTATDSLLIPGLLSLLAAEWLIMRRRHFGSGLEEALEVSGLTLLAAAWWTPFSTREPVIAAFFGLAFTIAGLRLLNPLLTSLAVLAFVLALDAPPLGAGLACYSIGLGALIAGGYCFRRPSHDRMLDFLVVIMPVAGYWWSASPSGMQARTDWLHAGFSAWLVPICSLVFAAVALAIGLLRRTHAPLYAFMLSAACAGYELRALTGLSLEARLIIWGSVLLLVSIFLERHLRVARNGVTSRRLRNDEEPVGILEIAGSAVLTLSSTPPQTTPPLEGGGGRFGGGGASGGY